MNKILWLALAASLGGCASFSDDGGFADVQRLTRERTGQTPSYQRTSDAASAARQRTDELLAQPLSADRAVEVALLNNRALQARFAELGVSEAELVRAGRLRNPTFSFGRLGSGGDVEIDRAVMFDVLGLLTRPLATRIERERFEAAQMQAASDAVDTAAEARRAYFGAVAAEQLVQYAQQVNDAADAAGELAQRMAKAGNFSELAKLREQALHADAATRLARARHQAVAARERLTRVLGLRGSDGVDAAAPAGFTLPQRLPDLPTLPERNAEAASIDRAAIERRLDVLMARHATESLAHSLGLTKATRFVNVLDAGYQNQSSSGAPRRNGYQIELELPLFDFGSTNVARAEAVYMQSVHRTAQVAIDARSQVREAYSAYRSAYDIARHYRDEIVPVRRKISEENLLRYNGMLASVFELLADAREQIDAVTGSIEAQRDFWLAQTTLQNAVAGRVPNAP